MASSITQRQLASLAGAQISDMHDFNRLNILYIHGFGSKVAPNSDKQIALREIGNVTAFAPDYTQAWPQVMRDVSHYLSGTDLLVGTSMGGFLVSQVSKVTGKPFVAINPVLNPQQTLRKYLGSHSDHYGRAFTLTEQSLATYPDFQPSDQGMVLLDMADELIDSHSTLAEVGDQMMIHAFTGGSHRFAHMEEALPLMLAFLNK